MIALAPRSVAAAALAGFRLLAHPRLNRLVLGVRRPRCPRVRPARAQLRADAGARAYACARCCGAHARRPWSPWPRCLSAPADRARGWCADRRARRAVACRPVAERTSASESAARVWRKSPTAAYSRLRDAARLNPLSEPGIPRLPASIARSVTAISRAPTVSSRPALAPHPRRSLRDARARRDRLEQGRTREGAGAARASPPTEPAGRPYHGGAANSFAKAAASTSQNSTARSSTTLNELAPRRRPVSMLQRKGSNCPLDIPRMVRPACGTDNRGFVDVVPVLKWTWQTRGQRLLTRLDTDRSSVCSGPEGTPGRDA